jgi:hypothetical protein
VRRGTSADDINSVAEGSLVLKANCQRSPDLLIARLFHS